MVGGRGEAALVAMEPGRLAVAEPFGDLGPGGAQLADALDCACGHPSDDPAPMRRRVETSTGFSVPSWAGCSTSATSRLAMNRPVRTGVPERVTSETSTTPRAVVTSMRRPAFVATISNVCVP